MTTKLHRTETVSYSAEQMFALVNDITHYPEFLPWCTDAEVITHQTNEMIARLEMEMKGIRGSFTTHNTLTPSQTITMKLLKGPFSQFSAHWHFDALNDDQCRITLDMKFQFAHSIMSVLFKRVFYQAANSMVTAFCQRAEIIYGAPLS